MDEIKEKTPLVYILVLNYCSHEDTAKCYNSIKNIDYGNSRVLVMDNNSPDGGGEFLLQNIGCEEFVQLNKNIGYSGGNNYGIEIALENGADYIFVVNPDVRLGPCSLRDYVQIMEANPEIGALNPVQLSSSSGPVDQRFKTSVLKAMPEAEILEKINSDLLLEVKTLFGASLFVSRGAIETVGGFDPLYFAYGEEEDFCRRLKYFNYKLAVTFKSPVLHLRNYNDQKINKFREFLRLKGRYLFILKDINRELLKCLKGFYYDLRADYFLHQKNKKSIFREIKYYKMFLWVFLNLTKIVVSRNVEKKGFSHLKNKTLVTSAPK